MFVNSGVFRNHDGGGGILDKFSLFPGAALTQQILYPPTPQIIRHFFPEPYVSKVKNFDYKEASPLQKCIPAHIVL